MLTVNIILKSESKQIASLFESHTHLSTLHPWPGNRWPIWADRFNDTLSLCSGRRGLCRRSLVKPWREADLCGSKRFLLDSIVDNPSNLINGQPPPRGSSPYGRPVSLISHLFHQWSESVFGLVLYCARWDLVEWCSRSCGIRRRCLFTVRVTAERMVTTATVSIW